MPTKKNPEGRPSKYKSEFCEMLVEHMAKGYTYEVFAARIDVCKDTLYEWEKQHKEFSDAKRRAKAKEGLFWESLLIAQAAGKLQGSASSVIFKLKSMGWKDDPQPDMNVENLEFVDQ